MYVSPWQESKLRLAKDLVLLEGPGQSFCENVVNNTSYDGADRDGPDVVRAAYWALLFNLGPIFGIGVMIPRFSCAGIFRALNASSTIILRSPIDLKGWTLTSVLVTIGVSATSIPAPST